VIEIYGPESSGKTTMTLQVIAEMQKLGGTCAFIDAEHALDPGYAEKIGVNLDELLVSQPDTGEQALEIADMLVRSGGVDVVVVDSVASLIPKAELEGEMESQQMGLQARMMAKAMRKLAGPASQHKTLIIFINQIRNKIGIMFGNPETTPGGFALKFAASVRIDIRKKEDIKDKQGNAIGITSKVKVIKNKMAPPMKVTEFDIMYGKGIDEYGCALDVAMTKGLFTQKGAWIYYHEELFAQGRENALTQLKENDVLFNQLKDEIAHV